MDYSFTSWSKEQFCESIALYGKFNDTYNPDTIDNKPFFFEPINCITACFIMFIGAYGLFNSKAIYYYEDLIVFSSVFFNGVASLLNHATLQIGWYNMDDLTMLLPATLAVSIHYYCLVILLNNSRFKKFYYHLFHSKEYSNEAIYILKCKKIIMFISMLYYYACITIASIPNYDSLFSILFGSSLLILWIPIGFFLHYLKQSEHKPPNKKLFTYFLSGGLICTISGIVWFSTEVPCQKNPALAKYFFFTHGIWHIGMSMGIYYLLTSVILLNYYLTGVENITFKTSNSNKCLRCWYKFLPVITQDKRHTDLPLIEIKH